MRTRHGMPEIKMKDDHIFCAYCSLVEVPLAIFYYNKRQAYYSKRVLPCGRCFGIYYSKEASPAETSLYNIQHLVPIEVRSQQEQADVSIVNTNHPAVNNVRDNVDARPTRRNAALNADILRRLRS